MEILYIAVPVGVLLAAAGVAGFVWASRGGQFDDLETPAHRVLFDTDPIPGRSVEESARSRLPPRDRFSSDE